MVAGAKLVFRCAACGNQYTVGLDKLPPGGAKGPCKKCGASITILPDGRMEGAIPEAQPPQAVRPGGPRAASAAEEPVLSLGRTPPPSTSFIFPCPSCGRPNEIRLSSVPPQGLPSECSGCRKPVLVFPDGRVSLQTPKPVEKPAPVMVKEDVKAWEIQFGGQTMGPFALAEMTDLIKAGRIEPDTPARGAGGAWHTAGAFPALAAILAPPEPAMDQSPIGNEDQCCAHPNARPSYTCGQCQRFLCEACAKESRHQHTVKTFKLCSFCGGLLTPIVRQEKWPPFYMDVGQVLAAPLTGHAILYFIILAFAEVIKLPCVYAGLMGLLAILFLSAFQWTFYLHVVNAVAHGSYQFPEWPESSDAADMFWGFVKVVFVVIVSLIPVFVVGLFASAFLGAASVFAALGGSRDTATLMGPFVALAMFLTALYYFYLPIPIAIVAVFETVLPALNPILIVRIIFRIGGPYFAAYALWVAFSIISASAQGALKSLPVPMIGPMLAAPLSVYFLMVNCYVLGRLIRENEERIGWQ